MKKNIFFLLFFVAIFLSCNKISLFNKKADSVMLRTDLKNKKSDTSSGTDTITDGNIDENLNCYYIRRNDSIEVENVMKYNLKTDSNTVDGVIKDLSVICNFGEVYNDNKIYVLGEGDSTSSTVFLYDIKTKLTTKISISNADFLAGIYKDSIITAVWNDKKSREEIYETDLTGNSVFMGVVDSCYWITNLQVKVCDNSVYILGDKKIYVFDLKTRKTKILKAIHADFIAGVYHDKIITIAWNEKEKKEEAFSISGDNENYLGVIDGLHWIVDFGVTLYKQNIIVLGAGENTEEKQIFAFDVSKSR